MAVTWWHKPAAVLALGTSFPCLRRWLPPPFSLLPFPWHLTCAHRAPASPLGTSSLSGGQQTLLHCQINPAAGSHSDTLQLPGSVFTPRLLLPPVFPNLNLTLKFWSLCVSRCPTFLQDRWVPPGGAPREQPMLGCVSAGAGSPRLPCWGQAGAATLCSGTEEPLSSGQPGPEGHSLDQTACASPFFLLFSSLDLPRLRLLLNPTVETRQMLL